MLPRASRTPDEWCNLAPTARSLVHATHVDVLIVGAGISGIGAAYHLQTRCPGKTYEILEGRDKLGGTWDLFRYPGIRSDSDMYTLGYSFRPWTGEKSIADGASILEYLRETAQAYGIDRKIRYGIRVESASYCSNTGQWTVYVRESSSGEKHVYTCNFLFVCAGYYKYEAGYTPEFAGIGDFAGRVVHPQNWTKDIEYADKRVVVIGSGATAMTLVPELAKKAAHVTMLQRSPTYVIALPGADPTAKRLRQVLPARSAYLLTRWKNIAVASMSYQLARHFPKRVKRALMSQVRHYVGEKVDVDTHFNPRYNPWDQRLCVVPDGDLFKAIRKGEVDVVTDHIDRFTSTGICLRSGQELEADLVVTATGLQMQFAGGIELAVDGKPVELSETIVYKGMMASDVPNCAMAMGYTNASWTLKVDLICEYVCRLINHMDAHGYAQCCPRRVDPSVTPEHLLDLSAGYVERARKNFPHGGSKRPWKVYQNYILDRLLLRRAKLEDGTMEFRRPVAVARESTQVSPEVA